MPIVRTNSQVVSRIAAEAFRKGQSDNLLEGVEASLSGDCERPVLVTLRGKAIVDHPKSIYRWNRNADLKVRCRACGPCLRQRSRQWTAKAVAELAIAQRTWFVTLTLTPHQHHVVLTECRKTFLRRENRDLETCGPEEIFRRRCAVIGREITKWLKRVRKNSSSRLRYLLVAEAHKSGLPHFHLLVHETGGSAPIRHRVLTEAWDWGFSSAKLVPGGASGPARYVSKYLAKSALARVRASARYGHTPPVCPVANASQETGKRAQAAPAASPNGLSKGVVTGTGDP